MFLAVDNKGASLQDWLDVNTKDNEVPGSDVGVSTALQQHHRPQHYLEFSYPDEVSEDDDSDTYGGNLAKQLAEAAVGVREMSKQLDFLIQNVLIVTKPRDNCLINLTHELALYLMLKHREGGRGLTVSAHLSESSEGRPPGSEAFPSLPKSSVPCPILVRLTSLGHVCRKTLVNTYRYAPPVCLESYYTSDVLSRYSFRLYGFRTFTL
ncbi:hypothetical protein C8R48DRAFT_678791 [Suillus tomentosus]|nr:hypothetical protein C8R48DRAFT_678791 [Suillus tomentosus]